MKLRLRSQPIDKQSRYNNKEHNLTQCITNRSFLKHGVPHLIRPTSRIGIWIQRSDTAKSSFHKLFHQPSTHLRNFSRPIFTWKIQLSDHPSEAHPNSGSITNEQTFSKHFTFKNNWFPNENLFVSVLNWPILTSYFSHTRNIITRFLHLINHSAASEYAPPMILLLCSKYCERFRNKYAENWWNHFFTNFSWKLTKQKSNWIKLYQTNVCLHTGRQMANFWEGTQKMGLPAPKLGNFLSIKQLLIQI